MSETEATIFRKSPFSYFSLRPLELEVCFPSKSPPLSLAGLDIALSVSVVVGELLLVPSFQSLYKIGQVRRLVVRRAPPPLPARVRPRHRHHQLLWSSLLTTQLGPEPSHGVYEESLCKIIFIFQSNVIQTFDNWIIFSCENISIWVHHRQSHLINHS